MKTLQLLGLVGLTLIAAGCASAVDGSDQNVGSEGQKILGGSAEAGFGDVGQVFVSGSLRCTGTLVAPTFAITASTCLGVPMQFKIDGPSGQESYDVVNTYASPNSKVALLQLTQVATDVDPRYFDTRAPAVNDICTIVGYGTHVVGSINVLGTKNSATVKITSTNPLQAQRVSGEPSTDDDGGPLVCGDLISGVYMSRSGSTFSYDAVDRYWLSSHVSPPVSYAFVNHASGQVFAVSGMSKSTGGQVVQWPWVGSADQLWYIRPNAATQSTQIRDQNSSLMLGIQNHDTVVGRQVQQFPSSSSIDQQWKFADQGNGYAAVLNYGTQLFLGVAQSQPGQTQGQNVLQWNWNNTLDQQWQLVPEGAARIRNVVSHRVVGVTGADTHNLATIVQYDDNNTSDHDWFFMSHGDGNFHIQNGNSGKVLAVLGQNTANGAPLVQYDYNGSIDQIWSLRYEPTAGRFRILNLLDNKVLGVDADSTSNFAAIELKDDNGDASNVWEFL